MDEITYQGAFDKKLFLEQLVYFEDINNFEILSVNDKEIPSPEGVKAFLEKEVQHYLNSNK